MKFMFRCCLILLAVSLWSCKTTQVPAKEDGIIQINLLQLNDVYEIAPLEGGKFGGMARVATLKKQLLKNNPNTIAFLAGDFLNPSVIGTLKYEGKKIKGRQMVDAMNAAGIDWVTFGNHEFDLDEGELQERINESSFQWVCANVLQNLISITAKPSDNIRHKPFHKENGTTIIPFPETQIMNLKDADGTTLKLGFFGLCLPSNPKDYVFYEDVMEEAQKAYNTLSGQCDVIVAITHLPIEDDKRLAQKLPGLALIMGGHDHDNMMFKVGNVEITKADANAKTAYIHRLYYNHNTHQCFIKSDLEKLDSHIKQDKNVAAVVTKWMKIADESFKKDGFNPNEVNWITSEKLDGKEASIRNMQTNLGHYIAESMSLAAKKTVDCAFLNSGGIRIDDELTGKITQYDILRTMPFGGSLVEMDIKGSLLKKVLDTGLKNAGKGGYLQRYKASYDDQKKIWKIDDQPIDENKTYHIIVNDFLLSGKEVNLDFFNKNNPEISNIGLPVAGDNTDLRNDLRLAFIDYLRKKKPN